MKHTKKSFMSELQDHCYQYRDKVVERKKLCDTNIEPYPKLVMPLPEIENFDAALEIRFLGFDTGFGDVDDVVFVEKKENG